MANNVPVNSEALVKILRRELLSRKGKFIVIGFPKSADNLLAWNKLGDEYVNVKVLIFFRVSLDVVKQRLEEEGKQGVILYSIRGS